MPDRGQRKGLFDGSSLEDAGRWTLRGARWLQVTFETPRDAVVNALPCDVTRTVPCYGRLFVVDAEESPVGPLRLAALLAGGRYALQPRNVVVQGVTEGGAVTGAFGSGFDPGQVTLSREGAAAHATVGVDAAQVRLPVMRAVDSTMLRWDPWMGFAGIDGEARLVEYAMEPAIERAFLAKGAVLSTAGPQGSAWDQFRCLQVISACYAEGTLVFGAREVREQAAE